MRSPAEIVDLEIRRPAGEDRHLKLPPTLRGFSGPSLNTD